MEETIINKVINEGFTISETQKLKKIPMTKWEEQSTSDEDEIIRILSRENVNYAILCGKPSNITVLDVNERNGGHTELDKLIKKLGDEIVDTFIVNTSSGFHIYYRYVSDLKTHQSIAPGITVKNDGTLIRGFGSTNGNGRKYKIEVDTKIAEMPKVLKDFILSNGKKGSTRLDERGEHLYRHGSSLVNKVHDPELLLKLMKVENRENCTPPLKEHEVEKICQSVLSDDGRRNPFEDKYVKVLVGNRAIAMSKDCKIMLDHKNGMLYHTDEMMKKESIDKRTGKKKTYEVNAFNQWWKTARKYDYLVFKPSGKVASSEYNLWNGFNVEPNPKGKCSRFLDHLFKQVCQENEEYYNFLLDWFAQIVQRPERKPGIAVALRGKQGIGKSIVGEIYGHLFGKHYLRIDSVNLENRFNGHLMNKLFVLADEAIWAGDKKLENKLKKLITEPTINIEFKGKDHIEVDNYMRILFTSNNDWIVPVAADDRRYFVLDVVDTRRNDREYFRKMVEQMENGGYGKLLHMLQTRTIETNWSQIPLTEAKVEQVERGLHSIERFYVAALEEGAGTSPWCIYEGGQEETSFELGLDELFEKYHFFLNDSGMDFKYTTKAWFARKTKEIFQIECRRSMAGTESAIRYYQLLPLDEMRQRLNSYLGICIV